MVMTTSTDAPLRPRIHRTYIGVTGYASARQAFQVHAATRHLLGDRALMEGYLLWAHDVSPRWGSGEKPRIFPVRFLSLEGAQRAFQAPRAGTLRLVHFRSQRHDRLDEQLRDCVEALGPGVDGFQINWIPRPNARELADFRLDVDRSRAPAGLAPIVLVLQLHPDVLEREGADLDGLVRYVAPYALDEAITHVLFDPSGGFGRKFNPGHGLAAISRLRREFPQLSFGVAGGLSADNVVEQLRPIWRRDSEVNIDAEGSLRDPSTDVLLVDRAIDYVSAALQLHKDLSLAPLHQLGD